jgi:hypothetical protein
MAQGDTGPGLAEGIASLSSLLDAMSTGVQQDMAGVKAQLADVAQGQARILVALQHLYLQQANLAPGWGEFVTGGGQNSAAGFNTFLDRFSPRPQ